MKVLSAELQGPLTTETASPAQEHFGARSARVPGRIARRPWTCRQRSPGHRSEPKRLVSWHCVLMTSNDGSKPAWVALGPAPRAELVHVLMLPTSTAPTGSASAGATHRAAPFAELLINCEEDRTLRAVLVGMLREAS
jgi:hypothetical protein